MDEAKTVCLPKTIFLRLSTLCVPLYMEAERERERDREKGGIGSSEAQCRGVINQVI